MKNATAFKTKKEFINYLIANKAAIIEEKKSVVKFAPPCVADVIESGVLKSDNTEHKDDLTRGKITRTVVGNTYNWMDSHDDVHLDGLFSESIAARQDKIWHLHDHEQKVMAKVGKPISIYEKSLPWNDLGVDKAGNTMALLMDSSIQKDYNKSVYNQYLNKEINQHSVAMQYEKIDFAVNDPEYKDEFAIWSKNIGKIGNAQKANDTGYFWAVSQAKLIEISAVLAGSNELTPTMDNKAVKVDKQVCPDCGDECCPDCGASMKEKEAKSFFTQLKEALSN